MAHEIDYKTKVELSYDKSSSFYEELSGAGHIYNIRHLLHDTRARLREEMLKQSKSRGFPYTSSWIIAYGKKPET